MTGATVNPSPKPRPIPDLDLLPRSEPLESLMTRTDETVPASALAPIVGIHPSQIVKMARDGSWDLCQYIISGRNVKFFRRDFLRRNGFLPEDPEDIYAEKLDEIISLLLEIREK